ncbi:MAG: hypothetical protein L6R36_005994, partial [Xanthoria steineri]
MGCRLSKSSIKEEPLPRSFRVIGNPTLNQPIIPSPVVPKPVNKEAISAPTAVSLAKFVEQVGVPAAAVPHIPTASLASPPHHQTITAKPQPTRPTLAPLAQPIRPKTAPGPEAPLHPLQSNPTLQIPRPSLLHRSSLPSLIPIPPPPNSPTSPSAPSPLRTVVFPSLPYVPPGMTLEQVLAPKGKRRMSSLREPGREMSVSRKWEKKASKGMVRKERGGRGNKGLGGEVREVKEAG